LQLDNASAEACSFILTALPDRVFLTLTGPVAHSAALPAGQLAAKSPLL
jgi:hypothetical protein